MPKTSVIVPWSPGCPHREAAISYVLDLWSRTPFPVSLGVPTGSTWCKADAVASALRSTAADILIVADADVWCPGVFDAVSRVESGAPWAIPHQMLYRLTREATSKVLSGGTLRIGLPTDEPPYRGFAGGGMVVVRRDVYENVPLDPRFRGWGQEDESWAVALRTMVGEAWRGVSPMFHLWHPPQERDSRRFGSQESKRLFFRYLAARGKPDQMSKILEIPRKEVSRG